MMVRIAKEAWSAKGPEPLKTKLVNEFKQRGMRKILEKAYTQYTLPKAIKKFGQKRFEVGFQEFDQLHKRTVFKHRLPNNLTQEEKKKAL